MRSLCSSSGVDGGGGAGRDTPLGQPRPFPAGRGQSSTAEIAGRTITLNGIFAHCAGDDPVEHARCPAPTWYGWRHVEMGSERLEFGFDRVRELAGQALIENRAEGVAVRPLA